MIPIVALWTAIFAQASVHALSVVPAEGRTEVVIEVDGPVTVDDFILREPARLVIDLNGAHNALGQDRFGGIDRGGVTALRVSQFKPDVVRVVVDLAQPVTYQVERREGEIRISFPNPAGAFAAWHSAPALAKAAPEPPAQPAPAPVPQNAAPRPQEAITMFFRNTPIMDVLATFAEFSGRSIIPGDGITATVNADIRNQPWDVALEALLQSYGLAAQEMESGIIRVDQVEKLREREKLEELVTRSFTIKYASADSLKPAIEGLLTPRGTITENSATNTLVVTDGRSVVERRIAPLIGDLDVRTPLVTIAAKIIFVDRTALDALGVTYDIKDSQGNQINRLNPGGIDLDGDNVISPGERTNQNVVRLGGASFAALANANERVASPALELLTSLVIGRHSLITFVDALTSLSVSDIQASPVVATMDHRQARVQVGEETPIRVIDAGAAAGGGAGGGANAPRASVSLKNTGIILEVTPHVTGNQVLLELHAERSNIALAPADIGVTFQKQAADTQILVNNGETAVISGMTIMEKSNVRVGIPFLMDLPVLGALFRTTTERETKKDLLIMVTPHIVREGES